MKLLPFLPLTFIPLALALLPHGSLANLLFLLSLVSGSLCYYLSPSPTSLTHASLLALALAYWAILIKLPSRGTLWKAALAAPLLVAPLVLFPGSLPLGGIGLALLLVLAIDSLSPHYPALVDRAVLLVLAALPIFLIVFLYLPLTFHHAPPPPKGQALFLAWAILLEVLNLLSLLSLFKGSLFKVQVRPSADLTLKTLAFVASFLYVLVILALEVNIHDSFTARIFLFLVVLGAVSTAIALSRKKDLLRDLRSYLLVHLYKGKVDFYRLVALLHRSATHQPWPQALKEFLDHTLEYSHFQGVKVTLANGDKTTMSLEKGVTTGPSARSTFPISPQTTLTMEAFFQTPPDRLDREILDILAHLLGSFVAMAMGQEQRELEEKFQLMDKLHSFIAHDLKNLAQTIKLYQENTALLTQGTREEMEENLRDLFSMVEEKTTKAIQTLTTIVPRPPRARTFNLEEAVKELVKRLPFHEKITLEMPSITMTSDPEMVTRILENLLFNAYQKDPDRIIITVRAHTDRDQVVLEVADSGPPVPEEIRNRIFEPFFSTKPKGLGLGLYAVKEYARALGGKVTYHQASGKTIFQVILPRDITSIQEESV